jgi:RNA polymerase sigma-70 factor, ECF subfamily
MAKNLRENCALVFQKILDYIYGYQLKFCVSVDLNEQQKLVEEAKSDTEAFGRLYDLFFPKVYAFVAAKVASKDDAEDLVSEIFVKLLDNLPKYQFTGAPFAAWLFRICRNELFDYYKKHGRTAVLSLDEAVEVKDHKDDLSPVKQAQHSELKEKVDQVMKTLSEKEKTIVQMKFYSGLNNREIAATLKMTEGNVGIILFRVLRKIKPELINAIE